MRINIEPCDAIIKGSVRKIKSLAFNVILYPNNSIPITIKNIGKKEKANISMSVSIIVKNGIIRLPSFNMKTGIDRINLIILQTLFFGNVLSMYLSIGINVSSQNGIESRAMASYAS